VRQKSIFALGLLILLSCVMWWNMETILAADGNDTANATPCDRVCLDGFVDQYLAALLAHDPTRLTFARTAKFTENGQRLELGDGLWHTVEALGKYKLYVDDPEKGQVGFFGTLKESGLSIILALRLKVETRQISEVETLVARSEESGAHSRRGSQWLDKIGTPHTVFLQNIPPADRASREDLLKTANMYFSGLERNDGKGTYPFTDDCNRLENGEQTTNNSHQSGLPRSDIQRVPGLYDIKALGCKAQFETGFFRFVTRIRDRRFTVVDRERGLVLAFVFFDHAGNIPSVTLTNGTVMRVGPGAPFTWEIAELFKIEKGKIRRIEAVLEQAAYGSTSGWSKWEHAISSRPEW
jgi:hypothetical protein